MSRCLKLMTAAASAVGIISAIPAAAATPCPISYSSLSMPYSYDGGISTPTVQLAFTNETKIKIVRAKFGLTVLGPEGVEVPYDQGLTFTRGADPGKPTDSQWKLDRERVDIHRIGEIIYLKSARFADDTVWKDDGNQRCQFTVNYGPK